MPDQVEPRVGAPASGDWTVRATDAVEAVVGVVRTRAVRPITTLTRWVVFGLLAAIVGLMSAVLVAILWVRVLDIGITGLLDRHRVWIADAVTGGIFTLVGLFLWRKRTPRTRP